LTFYLDPEMTNYINEDILCEAYTKLNLDIFQDKEKLADLETYLLNFFEERAKFYLGDDVKVKVEFEEGSLITKVKVIGGVALLLAHSVGEYGSFRSGVSQIVDDTTVLAQSANLEVIFRTKAAYCDRIDSERRKGILGRVDDLIKKLDVVHQKISNSKLPTNENGVKEFTAATNELINWDAASDRFFGKLSDVSSKACISAGLLEELEKLPEKAPWANQLEDKSFRSIMAKRDASLASDISGAEARYAAAIREVKTSMRQRLDNNTPQKV